MNHHHGVAIAVAFVGVVAACSDDGSTTSTTGAGGTGTGTGVDGTGGTAAGVGGTGGTNSGVGGQPRAGCDPYDDNACDPGMHCTVVDPQLGVNGGTACATPGSTTAFAACSGSSECGAGHFCDFVTATCKPFCENGGDCPDNSDCTAAQTATGAEIPGLKLCVARCEPVATTGCSDEAGPVNCTWRKDLEVFDCVAAGRSGELVACTEHTDCAVGLGCLEVNGQLACLPWCVYDGGTDTCDMTEYPGGTLVLCVPQTPAIAADGNDYGGCLKQL